MFQFRRFPAYAYLIQRTLTEYCSAGFPHSVICGSMLMCSSPQLIAACHDLLRLLMPRHSPCALISLTLVEQPQIKAVLYLDHKNYAGIQSVITAYCYFTLTRTAFAILLIKFPQHFAVDNLCCLLHNTFFLFVQFSRCTSGRNRMQTLDRSSASIRSWWR